MPVAVVTDTTSYLPAELVTAHRLTVVPLAVVLNGSAELTEDTLDPTEVATALTASRATLTTSRPAPAQFAQVYRGLLDAGAEAVLSVHLSAGLSGTNSSAALAADEVGPRVAVVDSRSIGMGLGFPVLAAARAAEEGADLAAVRQAALDAIDRTTTLFYLDSLEYLRRGGRITAASALLGTALSVKPILHVVDGQIAVRDRVRTAGRGLARLADLAMTAAGDADAVEVAVHHFIAAQQATELAETLAARFGTRLRGTYLTEAGAVVATHTGPGLVGVVVHRCD